ncbi:glycosyltransferase family 4 protein [Arsukibacterium sp.]|uniref:glycosyltransferase family 4 protein n=1 Tax=Arsukibacterium sp. TaxID=1977258 RepID=UPI001BD29D32|nr:glycosyltransferase family 4 protein [Arsukibacterium sp.]
MSDRNKLSGQGIASTTTGPEPLLTDPTGQVQRIAVVGTLAETMLGFRADLLKTMAAAGHQVYAFATDYDENSIAAVKALGVTPVSYQLSRFSLNPLADLKTCWQLYKLFKQYQISLSFCYFAKPVIYGSLAAWLARVPLRVAKIEGLGRAFTVPASGLTVKAKALRRLQVALYQLSLPTTHCVFLLNQDDKTDLIDQYRINLKQLCVLKGIGVELDNFPIMPVPTEPVRFIFVGRLLNEKGIRYYLAAAEQLKKRYPQVEFVVLGQPDAGAGALSATELEYYVSNNIVRYPGKVANVVPFLVQSSVFVLPSYYREGVPRSTQEAMAIGRAIITTDAPGCRETVEQGYNGILVPVHDQAALEQAMLYFIQQPEQICTMGLHSRKLAEQHFDVHKTNARIMNLLNL